MQFHILVHFRI